MPKKSLLCQAVGLLGENGRIRLGLDFAGGLGGFLRGGIGISLRGDGSLEDDAYFGGGVGVGALGGIGIGIGGDNAGGTTRGVNVNTSHELAAGVGFGPFGGGGSIPNQGSIGHPIVDLNHPQVNGGLSVGPKAGFAVGNTKSINFSARTPGGC